MLKDEMAKWCLPSLKSECSLIGSQWSCLLLLVTALGQYTG